MIAPLRSVSEAVDYVCAEGESHRTYLAGIAAVSILAAAVAPVGGYLAWFAIGTATAASAWGGVGYVSRWRGWAT
ncbi:hypothetical protein [Halorubrum ezzemoulense]|uniref:Uncharacterized protein n=1 Tax=Halorubrum ezzemoulense TaxID=337243 RepID=A0A256J8L7_HALEZ|nr:hypothetical protein [Halorubrum ezzemoulense]OYR65174.1 hypothetical protein DJ80_02765 [Halorubrum ezzemoulense]